MGQAALKLEEQLAEPFEIAFGMVRDQGGKACSYFPRGVVDAA